MLYTHAMDKKLMLIIVLLIVVGLLAVGAYGQVAKYTSRSEATKEFCMPGDAEGCVPNVTN